MKKEFVYISRAIPLKIYDKLQLKPNIAASKFNLSIIKGLSKYGKVNSLYTYDSLFIDKNNILENNIEFNCIPHFSHIKRVLYLIKKLQKLHLNKEVEYVLIVDVLCYSDMIVSLFMSKFYHWKSIAVITDLPEYLGTFGNNDKRTLIQKLVLKFIYFCISLFDYYILLTQQMINKIKRCNDEKSIVIEGFADFEMFKDVKSNKKKQILYAGSLHKEYGIETLVKAFKLFCKENNEFKLIIYGQGNYQDELQKMVDKNIIYKGTTNIQTIAQEESDSLLLINPRPCCEKEDDFTNYSFPSKNIEYMCSGTPMLAVKLPGMPIEYLDYIYEIKDSSIEGIYQSLKDILCKNEMELLEKGKLAKKFMKENKNLDCQVKRIINKFIDKN